MKILVIKIIIMLKMFGNNLNVKAMGDLHDLYLKSDILILSDVFENLRKTGKEYCKEYSKNEKFNISKSKSSCLS